MKLFLGRGKLALKTLAIALLFIAGIMVIMYNIKYDIPEAIEEEWGR